MPQDAGCYWRDFRNASDCCWWGTESTRTKRYGYWHSCERSSCLVRAQLLPTFLLYVFPEFHEHHTPSSGCLVDRNMPVTLKRLLADHDSYRVQIWTRNAPDVNLPETDPLMKRIMLIGRHFKVVVLGFDKDQKLNNTGLQSDINFESHKDSERKGNKNKIIL